MMVLSALVAAAGCASSRSASADARQSDEAYTGPRIEFMIETMESQPPQYAVEAAVVTPTGGYIFSLDDTEYEDGVLRLYLTLEGPGADETVTQGLVRHFHRHTTRTDPIRVVEAWVKQFRRGEDEPAAYRLAARTS
jgi:hypothetical protein